MKRFGKDNNLFYIVLGVAGIIVAVFFFEGMRPPTDSAGDEELSISELASQPSLYANPDFKIMLRYPRAWKPDLTRGGFRGTYLSFRGEDGYFGIDAIRASSDIPIDRAVYNVVNADAHPYGLNPTITQAKLGDLEARLILPSADQLTERLGEAAFIVRYPKPLEIASSTYFYFMLYADTGHIQSLAETLTFTFD